MVAELLKALTIFLFSAAVFLLVLILFATKFGNKTFAGRLLRTEIIKKPSIVKLVNLNQPGDLQYEYFDSKADTIRVVLASLPDFKPDDIAQSWIASMIKKTTGKNVKFTLQDIEYSTELNMYRLDALAVKTSDGPRLNIIYTDNYREKPSYTGITQHRDTIFIFKRTIMGLSDNKDIIKRLEQHTLMHEWGHLLGLEHSQNSDCIMSGLVELDTNRSFNPENIPTNYCWEDMYRIAELKKMTNF